MSKTGVGVVAGVVAGVPPAAWRTLYQLQFYFTRQRRPKTATALMSRLLASIPYRQLMKGGSEA